MDVLTKLITLYCILIINDATRGKRDRDCPQEVTSKKLGRCSSIPKKKWNRLEDNFDGQGNWIGQFIAADFSYECGVRRGYDCPKYVRGKKTRNTYVRMGKPYIDGQQTICNYWKHCAGAPQHSSLSSSSDGQQSWSMSFSDYENYYYRYDDTYHDAHLFDELYEMKREAFNKGFKAGIKAVSKYSRLLRPNPLN